MSCWGHRAAGAAGFCVERAALLPPGGVQQLAARSTQHVVVYCALWLRPIMF
jgi:hypothetical protein